LLNRLRKRGHRDARREVYSPRNEEIGRMANIIPTTHSDGSTRRYRVCQRVRNQCIAWVLGLSIVVAALALTVTLARANVIAFDDANSYPVGDNPKGLFAGDCDGDGTIDLLSANQNSGDTTTLRNDGTGHLEFGRTSAVGSQPAAAICADLTGDGLIDLATVNRDVGVVTIHRRKETGGFTVHGTRPAGMLPTALTTGDVNGDGILDMVAVGSRSDDITILLGTGSSSLPPTVAIRVPIDEPLDAAVADFNLDGHRDVAVVGLGAPFADVLFGSPTGLASRPAGAPSPFAATRAPAAAHSVATGDLNKDGAPDLAILTRDGLLNLYLGTGTGDFTFLHAIPVRPEAEAVALHDLNGDALTDLAIAYTGSNSVEVYLATAPGEFPLPLAAGSDEAFNPVGGTASRVVLFDAGDPESTRTQLITVDEESRTLTLVEQDSLDHLDVTPLATLPDPPETLLLADLTNDGILDAVVATKVRRGFPLQILRGTVGGSYQALDTSGAATCGNGIVEGPELCDDGNLKRRDGCDKTCLPEIKASLLYLAAVDFDGDTFTDLLIVDQRSQIVVLFGDGTGHFREVRTLGRTRRKAQAAVADFTGDGMPDIAFVPKSRRFGALQILVNDGSGEFLPVAVPGSLRFTGPMLVGDFDSNGWLDLAIGMRNAWTILHNDGNGPERPGPIVPTERHLAALSAADFDENGSLDVVTIHKQRRKSSVLMYRGLTTGSFEAAEALPVANPDNVFVLDMDGDRHQDIVNCNPGINPLCRALYGTGDGAFDDTALPNDDSVGREVRAAAAADIDGDGEVDLIGISRQDNRGTVVFRNADRARRARVTLATGTKPADMALADLDGNAIDDIIIVNEGSNDLSIFMNLGQRELSSLARVRLPSSGAGAPALASGDMNNDGRPDIVVSQSGSATVTVFLNIGSVLVTLGTYDVGSEPRDVAVGLLNDDEILDIVTANRSADSFTVLLSQPGGGYARTDYASGGLRASAVAIDDLNGDTYADLVITNEKVVSDSRIGSVVTFLNDGLGGFGAPTEIHIRGRETPRAVCTGDFDDDGLRDAAVASLDSSDILVLMGDGVGGWRRDEIVFSIGQEAISVRCFDADTDGRTDIAFGRRKAGDVGAILTGSN
jgi:cysteine-rich repeat protein